MATQFAQGFSHADAAHEAGRQAANRARQELEAEPDFAVVFCTPSYDCQRVLNGVYDETGEIPLLGGSAAGEFTDDGVKTGMGPDSRGVTVALIASDEMRFFTGLGHGVDTDVSAAVSEGMAALPDEVEGFPHRAGLVVSSTIGKGEEVSMLAYQHQPIRWAGGAASDASFENMVVFADGEVARDGVAFALIASKRPLGIATGHGHAPIGDPYEVTDAEANVVYKLDGEPAYDVWKRAVDETVRDIHGFSVDDVEDDQQRLFKLMAEMTFGIRTGDDEYKVRSPGCRPRPDGPLHFTDPIPEGTVLYPMAGKAQGTIDRARDGVSAALDDAAGDTAAGALVFDCICGELVLGEDYDEAISAMNEVVDAPLVGIHSFGEVCLTEDDMRGLHNGSVSILLFPG